MLLVFESEAAQQPLGMVVEHGPDLHYSWSVGTDEGGPNGVEPTKTSAVAAVLVECAS
jgi:hypothetical protein